MTATYTFANAASVAVGVAKSKVFLGTQTTTPNNDGFIEIGGVTSIPDFGPTATAVKVQTIGNPIEVTLKGVETLGGGDLELIKDETDAGQAALLLAQADFTGVPYNLRIIQPNPATASGTGTTYDIKTMVMSEGVSAGGPNNPWKAKVTLAFNTVPIKTAAS